MHVFFLAVVMSSSMAIAENCDVDEVCQSQEEPGGQEKMAAALLQVHTGVAELGKHAALANTRLGSNVASLLEQDQAPAQPAKKKAEDIVTARPKASAGTPDEVTFGIYAKTFLGASMKENSFDLDYVLLLKWNDPRVAGVLPAGMNQQTLSADQADKTIWMPEVVVTNRAIKGYEVISTVVIVHKNGDVEKVQRATVTCRNIFNLEQYPWDTQQFRLKIASREYMLDELVLKPSKNMSESGVNDAIFDAWQYNLDAWKVYSFEETDGAMKKSRGVLQIDGKHSLDKYGEAHLMPTTLLLIISFAVFWFPFMTPFVTPRMVLSVLALLAFTGFMIKSSELLPPGSPTNWNDVFNECVLVLMSAAIVINTLSEVSEHQLHLPHLGQTINHEAKIVYPAHSAILLSIVVWGGKYQWISVGTAQVLVRVVFAIITSGYIAYCAQRISFFKAEKDAKDAKDKEEHEQITLNHALAHDPRAGIHRAKTSTRLG